VPLFSFPFTLTLALLLIAEQDAVFSDALNHASIIDGIRLCKAQKFRYKHLDLADLDEKLRTAQARIKLVVTDGVFSMDGEVAPLKEIVELCDKHNAVLLIDECHATGFLGMFIANIVTTDL